jgi:AcrR family transcriptional regulator
MKLRPRVYRQVARAETAARTRREIVDAAVALFARVRYEELTLDAVAREAGVARQTVLRLFGSKEGLVSHAARAKMREVLESREPEEAGDVEGALDRLVASYERVTRLNWHLLVQEDGLAAVRRLVDGARALHRGWIERHFAGHLGRPGRERARRVALLFAATDYYVHKLYRRDLGLGRAETRRRIGELVHAVLGGFPGRSP